MLLDRYKGKDWNEILIVLNTSKSIGIGIDSTLQFFKSKLDAAQLESQLLLPTTVKFEFRKSFSFLLIINVDKSLFDGFLKKIQLPHLFL